MSEILTGGCQCGAVRYRVSGRVETVAICHCRMCQKATGSIAWAFFTVQRADLEWTRGELAYYRSSAAATRGYCAECGTPLTFESDGDTDVDLGLATLDTPAALKPTKQFWVRTKMPWFGELDGLPVAGLGDALPADEVRRRTPYQHPDHETAHWTPKGTSTP